MTNLPTDLQCGGPSLVLLIKDDQSVAQDLAKALVKGGIVVLGPVSTVEAALFLVVQRRPDAAMLDVALRSDLVNPVARTPGAMGVSFLVPRAYAPDALWSKPVIASARTLGKPTNPAEMIDASKAILG